MRSFTFLTAAAMLPVAMLAGCGKTTPDAGKLASDYTIDRSHKGDGWPMFTLKLWDGNPFIVTLWSTDCKQCESQLANLDELAAKGKIKVAAINIDGIVKPGGPDAYGPFLAAHKYKALEMQQISDANELKMYDHQPPRTYFYDKNGLLWVMKGTADFQSPEIQKLIAEAAPK